MLESNKNPSMLKMEFSVCYRQTKTSPSTEQSSSATLRFSASPLNSVWLSSSLYSCQEKFLNLSFKLLKPEVSLWRALPWEPSNAIEGKQRCPAIQAVTPASVAGGNCDTGRKGGKVVMWAAIQRIAKTQLCKPNNSHGNSRCCETKISRPCNVF